jgi:hypothetical protein
MNLCAKDRQVAVITEAAQALHGLMPGKRTADHEDSSHAVSTRPVGCLAVRCGRIGTAGTARARLM